MKTGGRQESPALQQSKFTKYQQLRLASNLAQDELATAQMNSWGPGLWGFPE